MLLLWRRTGSLVCIYNDIAMPQRVVHIIIKVDLDRDLVFLNQRVAFLRSHYCWQHEIIKILKYFPLMWFRFAHTPIILLCIVIFNRIQF